MNNNLIEEIKQRLPIDTLMQWVGRKIYKKGKHSFVHSPFRDERTPSCEINLQTNRFVDYGNGERGSVIDFWAAEYSMEFKDAITDLADKLGIAPRDSAYNKSSRRDSPKSFYKKEKFIDYVRKAFISANTKKTFLSEREKEIAYERLGMACSISNDEIIELTPENKKKLESIIKQCLKPVRKARLEVNQTIFKEMRRYCLLKGFSDDIYKYITKTRKISADVIERFQLFTINNYFQLDRHLKKEFETEDLFRAGLLSEKGNLIFYAHRLFIPYLHYNEPIYLRARYFDYKGNWSPGSGDKYFGLRNDELNLNSPKRLYNSDILLNMLPGERVFTVEGEPDVWVMDVEFKKNSVGFPGAGQLSEAWLKLLLEYNIIVCVDNDSAGNKLLTGHFTDRNGKEKYSENNLTHFFIKNKKPFSIKPLPTKDVNDFLVN